MRAVVVRRLEAADAARWRDIRLEALHTNPEAFGSTLAAEQAQPLDWFAARLRDTAVFAAFDGAELLGTAGFLARTGEKHAHKGALWGMYVRPQARRAGIGQRLVAAVIAHASGRVEQIQLNVVQENQAARRLYARLGFVEYGLERRALKQDGRYYDEILMAKFLTFD